MSIKTLYIERLPTTSTETQGFMTFGKHTLCTMERPWIPVDEHLGGKPFESCIPAGVYKTRLHARSNGDVVLALVNHKLNVYYKESEMGSDGGRYKVLIHSANWVHQVVGCIAPGVSKPTYAEVPMVISSRDAMKLVMEHASTDQLQVDIRWIK